MTREAVSGKARAARWWPLCIAAACIAALALLWRLTPLAGWAEPQRLAAWLAWMGATPWALLAVVAAYIAGGLVLFPLLLLISATAIVFDPARALGVAFAGTLASASVTYALGAKLLRGTTHAAVGSRLDRVSAALARSGVLAVAVVRTVPLAPFSVVNIAAGSIGVRFTDYLAGTAIGVAPGILALTAFGRQLRAVFDEPTAMSVALLAVIALCWIALSILLQRLVARRRRGS